MNNQTLCIIKPDAVKKGFSGDIISLIEKNKFLIKGMEKKLLTIDEATLFYAIHNKQPWFNELITFMTSGPVIVILLEKDNAVDQWRTLMGATDPSKSTVGTLRKMFGFDIGENALHGSDSDENAINEINFFFKK